VSELVQPASGHGNFAVEYSAITQSAAIVDCSARSRLCLLGADRAKFLHGQVTNNVKDLKPGQGCYAALVSAKGKIQSDLHIYILDNEILLEFEPGLKQAVTERLEKFVIAEDVQVADVSEAYGMWTAQGPKASDVIKNFGNTFSVPEKPYGVVKIDDPALGEIYITNRARNIFGGYDIFVPVAAKESFADRLSQAGGQICGPEVLEIARIEAGIPRFGIDMDDTNLAPEVLGNDAISYSKGCYIGQEVIARVRTYGQVAKAFRGLRLPDKISKLPAKGDKLFLGDKEAGYITSAAFSPRLQTNIALGFVRREANQIGAELILHSGSDKVAAKIVELPFAF
jgi:folate-binding protein YgfZ